MFTSCSIQQRKYREGFHTESHFGKKSNADESKEKIPDYEDDYRTAGFSYGIGYGNFNSVPLLFEIGGYGLNAFYDAVFISSKPYHSFGVTYDLLRSNPHHSIKLGLSLDANIRGRYEYLIGKPYSKFFIAANVMYGEFIPENRHPNDYRTLGNYFSPFSISIGKRISGF